MTRKVDLSEILKTIKDHERRIRMLEGKKEKKQTPNKAWYRSGSTTEKIVILTKEGFFKKPRSINEMISKLKTKDYHLKASDLTLPLRNVVRKNLLERTKNRVDGSSSKAWLYVEV